MNSKILLIEIFSLLQLMALTNEQILTRGDRKYAAKRKSKQSAEVSFDSASRTDFLTGFHKRKLARREEARKKAMELNRQQRLAERRRLREERKMQVGDVPTLAREIQQVDELQKINTGFLDKADTGADSDDADAEFAGFKDTHGILKKKSKYGDTDVVVEEIALDPFVDESRSEQVLEQATRKAHDYAAYVENLDSQKAEAKQKKRKKKFKYSVPRRQYR